MVAPTPRGRYNAAHPSGGRSALEPSGGPNIAASRHTRRTLDPLLGGLAAAGVVALVLVIYFGVNTAAMGRLLVARLNSHMAVAVLEVGGLEWGPPPGALRLVDVRLNGVDGETLVRADGALAQIDVRAAMGAGRTDIRTDSVTVKGFWLNLHWDRDGAFNFARAFPPRVGRVRRAPVRLDLRGIHLADGTVSLEFPSWGLLARGVDATGTVHIGAPALGIDASLVATGGHFRVDALASRGGAIADALSVDPPPSDTAQLPFDDLAIPDFSWKNEGFSAGAVRVARAGGAVTVTPQMRFGRETEYAFDTRVELGGALAGALTEGAVRGSVEVDARLRGRDERLTIEAPVVRADQIVVGGASVRSPSLALTGALSPDGATLKLRVAATGVDDPRGVSLSAPEVEAELRFDPPDLTVTALEARAGAGSVQASGSLAPSAGFDGLHVDTRLSLRVSELAPRALLPWLPDAVVAALAGLLDGRVSGSLTLDGDLLGGALSVGNLDLRAERAGRPVQVTLDRSDGGEVHVQEVDAP